MTSNANKEFLQKYMLDNYSRAIPTKTLLGKSASLGEYCEPIDSRKSRRQTTDDSDDYNSDPDHRYAQPQDALDSRAGKEPHRFKSRDEEEGDECELTQKSMEHSSTFYKKPSPKPRRSKHAFRSPEQPGGEHEGESVKSVDVASETPKRVGKKVVEIEYEVASEIRQRKQGETHSPGQHGESGSKSIINRDNSNSPVGSVAQQDLKSVPITAATAVLQSQKPPLDVFSTSQPVAQSTSAESVYEEPWDLKVKRLKEEQQNKAKKLAKRSDKQAGLSKTLSIYEDSWENLPQKQKPDNREQYSRSVSQTSETEIFHDALECVPESAVRINRLQTEKPQFTTNSCCPDSTEAGKPSFMTEAPPAASPQKETQSTGKLKPLPSNTYEDAWDLKNNLLERKIREMQMQITATYEEPWDLRKQKQDRQAKLQGQGQAIHSDEPTSASDQGKATRHKSSSETYDAAWKGGDSRPSVSRGKAKEKGRGCNIGQPINPMIPLSNQNWYHGNITRDESERMLCVCKVGSYIVRISSDRKSYSLSIKSSKQYIHVQIEQKILEDGTFHYILGKNSKEFCSIPEMIDYYTYHRVPLKGAEHITLLHPVECKWSY